MAGESNDGGESNGPLPTAVAARTDSDGTDPADDVAFPPLIEADDISFFFSTYDLEGLHWALTNIFHRSARNPNLQQKAELPQALVARGGGDTYTTEYKLAHDLEQARYLVKKLEHSDPSTATYLSTQVIPIYEQVLQNIPPLEELGRTKGLYAFTQSDYASGIGNVYNKALYMTTADELEPGWKANDLLSNELDWDGIQRDWFGESDEEQSGSMDATPQQTPDASIPGVLVIDDLLTPQTLSLLRELLLRNTHWFQTKTPLEFGKYVGSYIDDGLNDPIFLELAKELHQSMPRIMKDHHLRYLWAYKYDSEWESGINLHADQAAVNVNMWLSLEGADLEEEDYGGGLVVFTAKPPRDWDFESYNTNTYLVVEELLKPTDFANVTVQHRPNRAVIFDSALFHQTDRYRFKKGYENGRINLTLLFGEMQKGEESVKQEL
ncbi:hypothetical protein ACHAXT_011511 [Thalassiosira profunda]